MAPYMEAFTIKALISLLPLVDGASHAVFHLPIALYHTPGPPLFKPASDRHVKWIHFNIPTHYRYYFKQPSGTVLLGTLVK